MTVTLQSGFTSLRSAGLVAEDLTMDLSDAINTSYGSSRQPSNVPGHYSKEVTDLFMMLSNQPSLIEEFEFRERILIVAKQLEFTIGVFEGYGSVNTLSALHVAFMLDTIKFLKQGTRDVSIDSYIRMIRKGKETVDMKPVRVALEKFYEMKLDSGLPDKKVFDLVQWTRWPGGFSDLLKTLWAIYGRRVGVVGQ